MCEVIEIRVLKLGNADSIIVVLQKNTEILVVLIDTGRASHLKVILTELKEILVKYGKSGPDLVICTHYDFDHIGSLQEIVGRYKIHIKEVWMHKTSKLIEIGKKLELSDNASSLILPDEDARELSIENNGIINYDDDDVQGILQQLKHEVETLAALEEMGINPKEPIYELCSFKGWPEIEVVGPTLEYYKSLFPEHFDLNQFIEQEKVELKGDKENNNDEELDRDVFKSLDEHDRAQLTPTNLNSAIILIATAQGKFLFTGDAGIESFQQIPDYQNKISGVHFLKVPHHGSANNLNSELIQMLNPQIAFISGGSHVSNKVITALERQGANVYITTSVDKALIYPI